jgi:hypothetical protein
MIPEDYLIACGCGRCPASLMTYGGQPCDYDPKAGDRPSDTEPAQQPEETEVEYIRRRMREIAEEEGRA